jgi:hypothetical protein
LKRNHFIAKGIASMDRFEKIGRFKVRILKFENNHYSLENPNPDWEKFGLAWLKISEGQIEDKTWFKVAYIPQVMIEISENVYRVPKYRNIQKFPGERNFILRRFTRNGVDINLFRLYSRTGHPSGPIGGSEVNVDLSPIDDSTVILDLLKIAEKIYLPGEVDD